MNIYEVLEKIKNNNELEYQLDIFSDVIFLDEPDTSFEDDSFDVQTDWSIERVCAFAENGSGGKFYQLKDNSIGFESSEGQADRIAESMSDFIELIVYCPFGVDFCGVRSISYSKGRKGFFEKTEKERIDFIGADYIRTQEKLAQWLEITAPESAFAVSEKFCKAVLREPRFFGICREEGDTWETESLFRQEE